MKAVLDIKPVQIGARTVHKIEDGRGLQVTVLNGAVWVTQAQDPRDVVLARGQSFILDRNGRTVVYALRDADIIVGPAGHVAAANHVATPDAQSAA